MKILLRQISFRYQGAKEPVFQGLGGAGTTLHISGLTALFGLSGCGKSTLGRLIAGILQPDDGELSVEPGPVSQEALSAPPNILYSWNNEALPGWQSVISHLHSVTPSGREPLLHDLCEIFDLMDVVGKPFSRLSMGQRNRVNLLRYLLQDYSLLIADEVLANVDEPARHRILAAMKRLMPQRPILYISHSAFEVAAFARRIFVMTGSASDRQIIKLSGLDLPEVSKEHAGTVQARAIEILAAASGALPQQSSKLSTGMEE